MNTMSFKTLQRGPECDWQFVEVRLSVFEGKSVGMFSYRRNTDSKLITEPFDYIGSYWCIKYKFSQISSYFTILRFKKSRGDSTTSPRTDGWVRVDRVEMQPPGFERALLRNIHNCVDIAQLYRRGNTELRTFVSCPAKGAPPSGNGVGYGRISPYVRRMLR